MLTLRWLVLPCLFGLVACGGPSGGAASPTGSAGRTFTTEGEAPSFDGQAFVGAKIFDLRNNVWLDEAALFSVLANERLVFFGEKHETAPVQELELWVLQRLVQRHPDVGLAMEHFQRDEQPVLDRYLAGEIDDATFERTAQVWNDYAVYWKPLVELMKAEGRPVFGLNVPNEVLKDLRASATPLQSFNRFGASYTYDAALPPRPLGPWDAPFKAYFETGFSLGAHGGLPGLTPEQTLLYFTDLAHIRDETMGYWTARALEATQGRLLVVAGDWHVRTGIATPSRSVRYTGGEIAYKSITTSPEAEAAEVRAGYEGAPVADFLITYR